ncbi:MAG TPA: ROK family protein [Actinomycetota bacterium]|nr:ROK family protein [Actinomycetota bacterium]
MLEYIREMGPVSRAQIARGTGLSKPTVSLALAELDRGRLVREAGRSSGTKGPTAILYEMNPRAGWVVGIDVGKEVVRAVLSDLTGEVVARRDERARARSAASLIEQLGRVAHEVARDASLRWSQVTFTAIGSPGVFDPSRDQVVLAHNLPGWGRHGVVDALRRELGPNLVFENDVNLAAVGEQTQGLGKEVSDFVYLHVGTGVGLGLVLRGELYRGSHGAAGEVGYVPMMAEDPHEPTNRRRGALESALGAIGVRATARELGMRPPLTPARIFRAARRGDVVALRVTESIAERIALAVAAIVPVVDPELVVLGGEVAGNGDLLLEAVDRELHAVSPFRPRVEVSALGEDAVLLGAVATALQAAQERLFARGVGARR